MPFSFHHKNALIGKGQVIDTAKMVKYIEGKMQAELGEEAGRLVYTYDLPSSETMTLEEWEAANLEQQAEHALRELETLPWVKIALNNNQIPAEAVEEIAEMQPVATRQTVRERVMDLETMQVREIDRQIETEEMKPTGRMIRQLREGWKFENGELYRQPSVNDIDLDRLVRSQPQLPQWILDRIHTGRQTNIDVSELTDQIREVLESRRAGPAPLQSAQR